MFLWYSTFLSLSISCPMSLFELENPVIDWIVQEHIEKLNSLYWIKFLEALTFIKTIGL